MWRKTKRNKVTIPLTVHFDPDSGDIHVSRPTGALGRVRIAPEPRSPDGHPQLFLFFAETLREADVPAPPRPS